MPRKNKKPKTTNEPKQPKVETEDNSNSTTRSSPSDELKDTPDPEKPEKKGLLLSLDKKLKLQVKKEKKKQKKKEFEAAKRTILEEGGETVERESTGEVQRPTEDAIDVTESENTGESSRTPGMSEEEEKCLREFLRTLEIAEGGKGKPGGEKKIEAQVARNKFHIETIPEDLFEEFIENEEKVQTREAMRTFPRTSPLHSPTTRRRDPPAQATVHSPPKIFYDYHGTPVVDQDLEDGIVVIETFRSPEREVYPRRLDVILEESSDFSDASGHSDRRRKVEKKTFHPSRGDGAVVVATEDDVCDIVQPVLVEKMSEDVVKIELAESESDFDVNPSSEFSSEVEIVNFDEDHGKMTNRREKSVSSRSKEDTESWRSSLNQECGDGGAEADVESELDSQRTVIHGDDDLSLKISDSDDIEIFITEFKRSDPKNKQATIPNGKVNVKEIAEAIKSDMDKILLSKIQMMKSSEEPKASEIAPLSEKTNSPKQASEVPERPSRGIRTTPDSRRNPEALCNLAEKKVLTLPYGKFILRKIGLSSCCSKDSDSLRDLEEEVYAKSPEPPDPPKNRKSSSELEKPTKTYIEFDYSNPGIGETEKWYGMRTMMPEVLIGLSPAQKKVYEEKQTKWLSDEAEAASLLDLHRKFIERRSYHETCPWERERNTVYDSTAPEGNVSITEIRGVERAPGRLVGNANSRSWTEEEERRRRSDWEAVGNSRLLALLQNAISDEFVPELNPSVKSSGENHEVSVAHEREIMTDGSAKVREDSKRQENDLLRRDQKTFRDFWNKEKSYCSTENGRTRQSHRPKTICCGNELLANEPKFVKEVRVPRKTSFDELAEKEETVITENLPAVSDVIKSFEAPRERSHVIDQKNKKTRIRIEREKYEISRKGDVAVIQERGKEKRRSMPATLSEKEMFKQKMYDEYMSKLAERIERRQQKVIKLSKSNEIECPEETRFFDLENEFISKVKERKEKLGIVDDGKELLESLRKRCQEFRSYWEGEINNLESERTSLREEGGGTESTSSKRSSIQLLDTSSDLENLPKHLKELLQVEGELLEGKPFENMPSSVVFSPTFKATAPRPGVWSPAQTVSEDKTEEKEENEERKKLENEPIPPVWTPKSAQASPVLERKEFRPVNFESPTLPRKKYIQDDKKESSVPPPWQQPGGDKPPQLAKSPSSPALSLPKAPNPTVTLLQKAREGHLPRGAHYLNSEMSDSPSASDGTTIERLEIVSSVRSEPERVLKPESGPKKIIGIGPTTKEGIPLVLRSEVTEENKEKWYKRMYDSLHKYGKDDDYVTVKYRTSPRRKGVYNYQQGSSSGYQSEPESLSYDLSTNKYVTLDRRRNERSKENECIHVTLPRSRDSPPRRDFREYKNQPGRIEDYEPGHSSISEIEANKWWDEVLEIFDKEEEKTRPTIRKSQSPRSFTNYASGYISDPQYVYKRTEDELQSPPSSEEQKEAYRIIQKGGEIPLKGLRKPAPERPKDSFNTEIEYFPLSPTLTRIRVHKQNITPLSELPLSLFPPHPEVNYQTLPFGVCSSFSQVLLPPLSVFPLSTDGPGKEQKFSVHLQNISGAEDYVQIVPKPRSQTKKSPIYANVPLRERSCSAETPKTGASVSSGETQATFSDLKRTAPSVNSAAISRISKIPTRRKPESNGSEKKKKETQAPKPKTVEKKKTVKPVQEEKKKPAAEAKSSKRIKTISDSLKKRKTTARKVGESPRETTEGSDKSTEAMSPIYESVEERPKVESDMTEVFRSRSFSPEAKRKMFKFPDMNKPVPPKRKESKSPTWKMWSKMMVSYPRHRSRLDAYDSNVKYLGERITRKLGEERKPEFGDNVETVRTVKKDKNGDMSIKTNRYVRLTRSRATYPDVTKRKKLLSPSSPTQEKPTEVKKPNTVLRSSTTYSVSSPREEEDKRKSVKVTVAISSKGKDVQKKTGVTSPGKKLGKTSPSPSLSSGKSDKASVSSPNFSSPRSASPGLGTAKVGKAKKPTTAKPEVRKTVPTQQDTGKTRKFEKTENGKIKTIVYKKCPEVEDVKRTRDLVRTDSFFQNLFLRGPVERKVERTTSVLERARRYQDLINWPETYKSEPSLSLVTYYLSQKRPVSFSRFRDWEARSPSPLGSFHSESFQSKLRRFDSMSQFGDELKERSSSEPPLQRSRSGSPEQKSSSSLRSSPNSSRSPSSRRIDSFKPRRCVVRARSEPRTSLQSGDLGKSTSSLNLSNASDHATEYQAYVLELMHSSRKCERFRELHKFYSNLERMGKLEKTASTGDLRPRLRNEEIIDFDRWKKVRAKERAEAELKTLVDSLVKVQKEKDLLFRAADVEAVRWKGDSGLRIKERSVEDLKEQFSKHSEESLWRKDVELQKDKYRSLWRGSSIVDVASNLNNTFASHRGRPFTLQELEKLEKSKARIGKEYGYSLKAWSSLSNDQINALRDQLSEIYDSRRRYHEEDLPEKYEVFVPKNTEARSPGESSLHVRCSSALSKSQTFTPTVKRKEELRKEWKKADSIGELTTAENANLLQLPWKDETKPVRSQSEERTGKHDRYPVLRSKSASSSKPLSEIEKKRLSMTLSKEVIEKMAKAAGKGPVFPRETLGALAAAGSNLRKLSEEEWTNGEIEGKQESGSGSSETSVKTVIRKNSMEVLKKVQYFEELQQSGEECCGTDEPKGKDKKKNFLVPSSSVENLDDYFGQQKQYATAKPRNEEFYVSPVRYYSTSPLRSGSSNDSLFSYRSRSVSPDPTKYYRAYLRMVKCGAVRKLCNKFESWEDLLSLSSDRDFWLPPPPRRFASDPELTRDLLKRFGTDPTKVTVRGQEVGDVRWLRTKFENPARGRSRSRRPLARSPLTVADRFMPRINVISKTAELQLQGGKKDDKTHLLAASPEGYRSLIDYTKDHGGYYYTGEVEKLRRKFERLQEAERLSILGQMYTSTPDVNELRDIAPYLECSWIAHRYPGVTRTATSSPAPPKKTAPGKPRPRSSSPPRPKRPSSILKPSAQPEQKFDPTIHRPRYRYQPEREADRRYKRGDPDWWRHWTKPTVTFKETVSFNPEPEIRDLSPESPRKYVESEVTIHYKSPVRSEAKAALSEDELARRQAESMKRIYKEERRRKYLQELQDMNSRRHTDNFIPSQKSPIALNRYDDFPLDSGSSYYRREYSTDPVLVARGLYDFVGRRPRELGFRRGDIIFIVRKLDKNWCEGELNGVVGLFPLSYVEVIPYNEINLKYGRARAKYDFIPQTSLELLAHKGDMITLLRKIDENWFEGRIGERTGIIPASYCHVLAMPQAGRIPVRVEKTVSKPVAAPAAHSLIHNGSGLSSKHYYTPHLSPSSPGRSTASSASVNYHDGHPTADMLIDEALMQLDEEFDLKRSSKPAMQPLNVRINPRPEPELYQVLFNHVPNNDDELELVQGETVTVVEKCGDGWYIGSKSDGKLGIFPGTHVRRIAPDFV